MLIGGGIDMKEFVFTLLGVSLISGFASMLSPEGKGGGLRSYLGFACALCTLSIAAGPILSFVSALADGKMIENISGEPIVYDYEMIFDETISGEGERSIEEGLLSLLRSEFEIEEENIDVDVRLCEKDSGLEAELVTVSLSGGAVFIDAHKIVERVEKLLSCECRVVYGGFNNTKG